MENVNISTNPELSPYYKLKHRKDNIKNIGFNYKGKILVRTLSAQMFDKNPYLTALIIKLEDILFFMFESVKSIKVFGNYAMEKNEKRIN